MVTGYRDEQRTQLRLSENRLRRTYLYIMNIIRNKYGKGYLVNQKNIEAVKANIKKIEDEIQRSSTPRCERLKENIAQQHLSKAVKEWECLARQLEGELIKTDL